ncbi:MAG: aminopeptidase P family protein [Alphaproteobacteria bacterium]|nr:aminopeptidase P family protein [Alphaproteobacteria bacterium]
MLAKKNIALKPVKNLVDEIWVDRPAPPASELFVHGVEFSGESSDEKRKKIAAKIKEEGALACILTSPESVCWLLNVRGGDVENTPVALMTAIIDKEGGVRLYIGPWRVSDEVKKHLGAGVKVREPIQLESDIRTLASEGAKIMLDSSSAPVWFAQVVADTGGVVIEATDPCTLPKACKNNVELAGIRAAHIRDGAAVAKLLCWLDGQKNVTEIEVADKLLGFRQEQKYFRGASFPTIAGSGPHGAIVHYRATDESNRTLQTGELFLLDSGGQYRDGTTDITRTVAIGAPSAEHKDRFTRVLKGHIAIATARFPVGTAGSQLDALARHALWEVGLDYDHGTGHGVGQFLGVHEGPQRISKRGGDVALAAGMIVSNEPGYYKTGAYGIRIENLVAVAEREQGEAKKFLGFDTLTCAPMDTRLVEPALLTPAEKKWLNDYHAWVLAELSPALSAAEQAWLASACAPIN